jgi:hypothetical protein
VSLLKARAHEQSKGMARRLTLPGRSVPGERGTGLPVLDRLLTEGGETLERGCVELGCVCGEVALVHGRTTIEQEITDWLPPHHYTFRERNPAGLCLWTVSLAPLDGATRTRIEWRIALGGGRRQAIVIRVVGGRMRRVLQQNFDALLAHVQAPTAVPQFHEDN